MQGYVKLSEKEVSARLAVTLSRRQKKIENQKKQEKLNLQQAMAKRMMEAKMKQKLQHQGVYLLTNKHIKISSSEYEVWNRYEVYCKKLSKRCSCYLFDVIEKINHFGVLKQHSLVASVAQ